MFRKKANPFLLVILLVLVPIYGCESTNYSGSDPKKVISEYISQSFSVKKLEDRQALLKLLTGGVKARLASWSDEQFQEAFVDSKRQFIKLSFREVKNVSPTEVQITYEMVYVDKAQRREGKDYEAKITNRKLCQLVLEQGKWYISDVRNIKELLEFKDELSLP
jgi:hypothetical protein